MLEQVTAACDRVVKRHYKESGQRRASLFNVLSEEDIFLKLITPTITGPAV